MTAAAGRRGAPFGLLDFFGLFGLFGFDTPRLCRVGGAGPRHAQHTPERHALEMHPFGEFPRQITHLQLFLA